MKVQDKQNQCLSEASFDSALNKFTDSKDCELSDWNNILQI